MTPQEKNIIDSTKEFAKANDIAFDGFIESMILNTIREVQRQLYEVKTVMESNGSSGNVTKNYHVNKHNTNPSIKKITPLKRYLIGKGFPIKFISEDKQTYGRIDVNDKCDIVLTYECAKGKLMDSSIYFIDADNTALLNYTFTDNEGNIIEKN